MLRFAWRAATPPQLPQLATAVALNTDFIVVEANAGVQAHSLSLVKDSIHKFSDELALLF